jgi:hypothetical protein
MKRICIALLLASISVAGHAEALSGLCMVSVAHNGVHNMDTADVLLRRSNCDDGGRGCGTSENSNISWARWTGVSTEALSHEGAQLTGLMSGDAGELRCSGVVHDGVLAGRYQFTPNAAFVQKMSSMGFGEITENKQEGMLLLDVNTAWVAQMKDAGVTELSTGKLMGLRALHVDLDYIHAMAAAGFPELRAGKLTEMKAVGVTPEKAKEARALGFQPTEQDLIQMSIFKIDRPFVERMRAKGLQNLTLAKLIQIKIFKLDD